MGSGALDRYYSILDGEASARYLSTKATKVAVDISAPTDELWRVHADVLRGVSEEGAVDMLELKTELARRLHSECEICERRCRARRSEGEAGHCGVLEARVTDEFLHMGEEPDLIPSYTVFFAGCTFECVYCQNWDISTNPRSGMVIPSLDMAQMIERRMGSVSIGRLGRGCTTGARNVNWVGGDPSSNLLYILQTLRECEANIPQVWNSNMYLTKESMALLEGVVDVYLTDLKYGNDACASRLSNAPDYMRIVTRNHLLGRTHAEMIVRHLVLPGHVECCTRPALTWIASNLKDVKVNVMAQYRPEHRSRDYPDISRRLLPSEFEEAVEIARTLGLELVE